jgi:hypothetical protein
MASSMGYSFPLLSNVSLVPSTWLTVTVKDEMPVDAGILAVMGKKANVSSNPWLTPCTVVRMVQELEPQFVLPSLAL